jgi:hypothetical protein
VANDGEKALVDAFDNAQVPISPLAQHAECFLVGGAVVCGDRLRDAVEFDQDGPLTQAALIGVGWSPARQETRAGLLQRGSRKLGIRGQRLRIVNGAIRSNPVGLGPWEKVSL